ncbi:UvrD-helicase domain-containing protein [Vulcaniibacterium thermophilum]|uniref:RecBCD enzyme subunit RecB n=1 Tax=Vulcaniibacterium thermophilum TaxID=1169913 RepID=A0A918YWL2_9GAMM|nr:exodeoxyribonuclease V subunit beta [Vulcaniibacterium thermophilum]GHE27058.1 RecBCD enzyme subunit RecB [Vulcaniibacterium thermophilum]
MSAHASALAKRRLIEASAGTGKTYALAGRFARAVIVDGVRVPRILAVTYTVKATEELQERVRLRLQRAAELAAGWDGGEPREEPAEDALLRALIAEALGNEALPALQRRLQRAARELDLAAILTIHQFCQRVLREQALLTGQPLLAAELQPDNLAARRALAVALWREAARDAEAVAFLRRAFGAPDRLAEALADLLAPEPLLPAPPDPMPRDPRTEAEAAWRALVAAWRTHGEAFRARLAPLFGNGLNRGQYKPEHAEAAFDWLARQPELPPPDALHEKLAKYGARALAKGCNKGATPPDSPLCAAIDALLDAREALAAWCAADDLRRLHALRERARALDARRKQAFNVRAFDDLIEAVHAALREPDTRAALVAAVRERFALALVDEFQDTDARQWAIFDALFERDGLVLVGDPKQAIYRFRGGDIATYLAARDRVDEVEALTRNFRSRPCVIGTVNALFERMSQREALGAGIAFDAAQPGGRVADADLVLDDAPAPALRFHAVPPLPGDEPRDAEGSRRIAAGLCAQAIVADLQAAADGRLRLREGERLRALEPRDCAVLVRSHREAADIRQALAGTGVPVAAAGRGSLYESDEALDLLTLLLAVRAPGDERRVRAALASPLFGFDAAALAALDAEGDALRRWQQRFESWRARWERHGPQAMLTDVLAERAEVLRALTDGERRLANWLQLGELLQETRAQRLGTQGQIDALRAAIANADRDDEAQWPRLESDAACVQILTLHASKGLEFPLVYLPFLGLGQNGQVRGDFALYTEHGRRVRYWRRGGDWKTACQRHLAEEGEETMRLLYVGLTRARHALWVCGGALAKAEGSPLAALLGGTVPSPSLREALGAALELREGEPAPETPTLRRPAAPPPPAPRAPRRTLRRDWWIHSFSQLHRQLPHGVLAGAEESPALDERALPPPETAGGPASAFAGERFGNALHHALEHADFAAWRGSDGAVPDGQREVLLDALRSQQYPAAQWDAGIAELAPLVARTLNAALPAREGAFALCALPPGARVAEMEFHFALADADSRALLSRLHAHGVAAHRQDFGGWTRLAGLMTGKIDLVCRVDGALYVLDYKSNRLRDYEPDTIAQAMRASEYDLQALLYTVAVHRWLRARRGTAYDYGRDIGGVRYLFCRGLDPQRPGRGVHALRFDRALVEGVDALLGGTPFASAAPR